MNRRNLLALASGFVFLMVATHDAERMAAKRAAARDLVIPECKEPARRADAEANDQLWLKTYLPSVFYSPFTPDQSATIESCGAALRYGTQRCKAAPRGDGKSSTVKYLALKYALKRQTLFPLLLGATGKKAKDSLESIKRRLAEGMMIREVAGVKKCVPRTPLGEDYPLECAIAAYVNPWPSRARNLTANGGRSIFCEWDADRIILPTWEDAEPLGPILFALGITSDELQGCVVYDRRPDFVMLDDLDSRDSLASTDGVVAAKLEEIIDKAVAGLGGQSRRLGKFMLCTVTSRESAAWKYSDPAQKQWSGERVAAIKKWPTSAKWQEYIELRQWGTQTIVDGKPTDEFGRKAHEFYLVNQAEMDEGAELSNPHNFERETLPGGSQKQVSALQRCYDFIADHGLAAFQTEYQNDPPEDDGVSRTKLTPRMVQKQLSGLPRGIIPKDCTVLTHTCDVGKTKGFHWVVRAWRQDGTRFVIDHGRMEVAGAKYGSDAGLDRALFAAVQRRAEEFKDACYRKDDGEQIDAANVIHFFDARWKKDVICAAVKSLGIGFHAYEGIGKSGGAVKGKFRDVVTSTATRRKCGTTGAYEELYSGDFGKIWVVHGDADRWKAFEHEGWLTALDKPGASFLFGEDKGKEHGLLTADEHAHDEYAAHICNELEAEVMEHGFPVRKFIGNGGPTDYLDASYMSDVAAAMKGVRVVGSQPAGRPKPQDRPSARDLAKKARGAA